MHSTVHGMEGRRMNIDEAIAHAREKAEEIRENIIDGNNLEPYESYCIAMTERYAEEQEQLAEWLENLKAYRELGTVSELENIVAGMAEQELYREGYANAIGDFKSKLIMHFADWELSEAPFNDDETDRTRETICETIENAIGKVEEIAEQLKAGDTE